MPENEKQSFLVYGLIIFLNIFRQGVDDILVPVFTDNTSTIDPRCFVSKNIFIFIPQPTFTMVDNTLYTRRWRSGWCPRIAI